jgi:hypothetical protein
MLQWPPINGLLVIWLDGISSSAVWLNNQNNKNKLLSTATSVLKSWLQSKVLKNCVIVTITLYKSDDNYERYTFKWLLGQHSKA